MGRSAATTASTAPDPNGQFTSTVSGGALPDGGSFVTTGKGTWHLVPGSGSRIGAGGRLFRYTISVEDGVESSAADQEFAAAVDSVLADPRSWIGSGLFSFERITTGTPDFTVSLTSQITERRDDVCGWQIKMEASCYARDMSRVSINDARWSRGAASYNGDLGLYRIYAINHEVGHALGYGHQPCAVDGGLAPVMMQQSWSVKNDDLAPLNPQLIPADDKVCQPNPYPFPRGRDQAVAPQLTGAVASPAVPTTSPAAGAGSEGAGGTGSPAPA